jgi:hypothetical protein
MSKNLKQQSYLFFMNSKEVNNRKGLVGLGMRELADTEKSILSKFKTINTTEHSIINYK